MRQLLLSGRNKLDRKCVIFRRMGSNYIICVLYCLSTRHVGAKISVISTGTYVIGLEVVSTGSYEVPKCHKCVDPFEKSTFRDRV